MGEAEAFLVATVGVTPERVPGAAPSVALDLQVSRWARLLRSFGGHPTRLPTAGEHERGTRVSQTHGMAASFGLPTAWARQDSNLDLTDYESAALTIELRARVVREFVGLGSRRSLARSHGRAMRRAGRERG